MKRRDFVVPPAPTRKSLRLQGISPTQGSAFATGINDTNKEKRNTNNSAVARRRSTRSKRSKCEETETTTAKRESKNQADQGKASLPRTQEDAVRNRFGPTTRTFVMGIDEAGRGPLAGPVVAAAALVPSNVEGICDSKKLTKEDARQEVFDRLVVSPGVVWAAAVMDAQYIDKVNILQATMHGMALAAQAVIHMKQHELKHGKDKRLGAPAPMTHIEVPIDYHSKACSSFKGCYVVTSMGIEDSANNVNAPHTREDEKLLSQTMDETVATPFYALIDGNRLPQNMPCEAEAITKGDGKEYAIASASIIAKVVRDNLMREYHELYPSYNLQQHKGYPSAAHMAIIRRIGASPIHRRSFNPLKSMEFDKDGKVISE